MPGQSDEPSDVQIRAILDKYGPELLDNPHVSGVGIQQETRQAGHIHAFIQVYVDTDHPGPLPTQLDGVEVRVRKMDWPSPK